MNFVIKNSNLGDRLKTLEKRRKNEEIDPVPKIANLLLCLFCLFLLHFLVMSAMCCILLLRLPTNLYFFDILLPHFVFVLRNIPSNPPVLKPSVFKSSCAINTYVLILPLLICGYPAIPPHAAFPKSFVKMHPGWC